MACTSAFVREGLQRGVVRTFQVLRVATARSPRQRISLKGVSSRRLRQEFPDLVRHYWRANKL